MKSRVRGYLAALVGRLRATIDHLVFDVFLHFFGSLAFNCFQLVPSVREYQLFIVLTATIVLSLILLAAIAILAPSGNLSNLLWEAVGILLGTAFTVALVDRVVDSTQQREARLDSLYRLRGRLADIAARLLWASAMFDTDDESVYRGGSHNEQLHELIYSAKDKLATADSRWSDRLAHGTFPEKLLGLSPSLRVLLATVDFESRICEEECKVAVAKFTEDDLRSILYDLLPRLTRNVATVRIAEGTVGALAAEWARLVSRGDLTDFPALASATIDQVWKDVYVVSLVREQPRSWKSREPSAVPPE